MAYQTGTATDIIDLLDKLRAFALGLGWTVHRFDSGTDGWLALSHASAGYFNLRKVSGYDHLEARGATGYDSGAAFESQPGVSGHSARTNGLVGPFQAFHIYGDTQYMHVVVEVIAGLFRHFHIGKLDPIGTWTGGEYVTGTYWEPNTGQIDLPTSTYHSVPFDARTQSASPSYRSILRTDIDTDSSVWRDFVYLSNYIGGAYARGFMRANDLYVYSADGQIARATPNTFNGLTPLLPSNISVDRTGDTARFSPAGNVPNLRAVSMRNLTPGQQITIGSDVWDCYPLVRRTDDSGDGSNTENSYHFGIAYQRITP